MYESPIKMIVSEMQTKMETDLMVQVSQTMGVEVDKAELIKALKYDRDQYRKGLRDVCTELSYLFKCPCNHSPVDVIMADKGGCTDEDCSGEISNVDCWLRYMEVAIAARAKGEPVV